MKNLNRYNNIANSHLTMINLKMIKSLTNEKKIYDILHFDESVYESCDNVYSLLDSIEFNLELLKGIDNDYKCAKLLYENIVNIEKKDYLDIQFWNYLATDFLHVFTLAKLNTDGMSITNYKNKVLCKSIQNKDLFNNYLAKLWFVMNLCYDEKHKYKLAEFVFSNPQIIEVLFKSEIYLNQTFLKKLIVILFENKKNNITDKYLAKIYKEITIISEGSVIELFDYEMIYEII